MSKDGSLRQQFFKEIGENSKRKNKENDKNFQQYFIYNNWLHWSISMSEVSF